jgi:hypothetical protein
MTRLNTISQTRNKKPICLANQNSYFKTVVYRSCKRYFIIMMKNIVYLTGKFHRFLRFKMSIPVCGFTFLFNPS